MLNLIIYDFFNSVLFYKWRGFCLEFSACFPHENRRCTKILAIDFKRDSLSSAGCSRPGNKVEIVSSPALARKGAWCPFALINNDRQPVKSSSGCNVLFRAASSWPASTVNVDLVHAGVVVCEDLNAKRCGSQRVNTVVPLDRLTSQAGVTHLLPGIPLHAYEKYLPAFLLSMFQKNIIFYRR